MKNKRLVLALFVCVSMVSTSVAAPPKPVNDDFISDSVRQKLAADSVVKGGGIEVEVKDGMVTLKGKVQEPQQKEKAEKLAKRVKGVKSVVNEIKIEKL